MDYRQQDNKMIIIMKKYTDQKDDDRIRQIISSTKMKAPDNLKYRIMHQLEYEKTLTPQNNSQNKASRKENGSVLKDLVTIFGAMYAVLAGMTIVAYFVQGKLFYQSIEFLGSVSFVAFVFSLFWLISRLDAHLKGKKKYKLNSDK
jgi:type II secretory pathway component PulF